MSIDYLFENRIKRLFAVIAGIITLFIMVFILSGRDVSARTISENNIPDNTIRPQIDGYLHLKEKPDGGDLTDADLLKDRFTFYLYEYEDGKRDDSANRPVIVDTYSSEEDGKFSLVLPRFSDDDFKVEKNGETSYIKSLTKYYRVVQSVPNKAVPTWDELLAIQDNVGYDCTFYDFNVELTRNSITGKISVKFLDSADKELIYDKTDKLVYVIKGFDFTNYSNIKTTYMDIPGVVVLGSNKIDGKMQLRIFRRGTKKAYLLSVESDGKATFNHNEVPYLNFTSADIGKTIVYEVIEKEGVTGGLPYDKRCFVISIKIESDSEGKITPVVTQVLRKETADSNAGVKFEYSSEKYFQFETQSTTIYKIPNKGTFKLEPGKKYRTDNFGFALANDGCTYASGNTFYVTKEMNYKLQ